MGLPDPALRHRLRRGGGQARGGEEARAACSSRRSRPTSGCRISATPYDPLWPRSPETGITMIEPPRPQELALGRLPPRPDAAEGHLHRCPRGAGRDARHVDPGRRVRPVPAPQGGLRRAGPRMGAVVLRGRLDHACQRYEFPAMKLLPSHYFRQNVPHVHRRADAHAPRVPARGGEHHVVVGLPASGVELAELPLDGRGDVRGPARARDAARSCAATRSGPCTGHEARGRTGGSWTASTSSTCHGASPVR